MCRGVWHLHPTTLNEAVDASGKRDLISLVYLQKTYGRHGHFEVQLVAMIKVESFSSFQNKVFRQ